MTESAPLLKLFIGYPLTGELKGALRRRAGWEIHFSQSDFEGVVHIGRYLDKSEIDPEEIEKIIGELDKTLATLVPELVLHLPKAVIFPKVLIS